MSLDPVPIRYFIQYKANVRDTTLFSEEIADSQFEYVQGYMQTLVDVGILESAHMVRNARISHPDFPEFYVRMDLMHMGMYRPLTARFEKDFKAASAANLPEDERNELDAHPDAIRLESTLRF